MTHAHAAHGSNIFSTCTLYPMPFTITVGGDVLEDTANSEDLLDDDLNDDLLDEDKDLTDPVVEEDHILNSPTPSDTRKSISPDEPRKPEDEPTVSDGNCSSNSLLLCTAAQGCADYCTSKYFK